MDAREFFGHGGLHWLRDGRDSGARTLPASGSCVKRRRRYQRAMTALKPFALRHRSVGQANLYFKYSRGGAWSWEHRIMKEASHALEQCVGVRAEVDFV